MGKLKLFLKESNKIEDVFDEDSLKQAMYAWEYLEKQEEMSCNVVLKAHGILMLHQDLQPDEKGCLRKRQVWVGGQKTRTYPMIRQAMEVWCLNAWLYPKNWKAHHIRFEKTHPFVDGNGRIGRLLMNWQRVKTGLPIKVIKASERDKYYKWFN